MAIKRKYSAKEVCEEIPINITTLRHLTVGRNQGKDGKWHTPPILQKFKDYKIVLENNHAKYYYYPSAIEKLRAHKGTSGDK